MIKQIRKQFLVDVGEEPLNEGRGRHLGMMEFMFLNEKENKDVKYTLSVIFGILSIISSPITFFIVIPPNSRTLFIFIIFAISSILFGVFSIYLGNVLRKNKQVSWFTGVIFALIGILLTVIVVGIIYLIYLWGNLIGLSLL
jgi:hypothetical protein